MNQIEFIAIALPFMIIAYYIYWIFIPKKDIEREKEYLTAAIKKSKQHGLKEMCYPLHFEENKTQDVDYWLLENGYRIYLFLGVKMITWHHHLKG